MKLLRKEDGFTLTEVMVAVAISGFLMVVAAIGFSAFFSKFNAMSKAMELQRGAFDCLQTIKNGVKIGSGTDMKFQGVATADSVKFLGTNGVYSDGIILYPPVTDYTHQSDFIKIYYDGRYVRATYLNGTIQPPSPLYLFPQPVRGNTTEVTKLLFSKANVDDVTTKVINVTLEARTKIRKNEYKTISYTTKMALSMK
ncbi:MAG TPA: type II secretion system protein [Candidatus Cloacimonadota bacterium]|nr:type II secretion system protein [Candidatus Cloacimonadota bacterium]HOV16692.1 type II secretion system protein [Candidatus Cloacimonadota bacterium]HQL14632.1 type II secretion system protein [Candidatus Cloacimonadota bacterium]